MKLKNNLYKFKDESLVLREDGTADVQIELLPECKIYKAHFPEQPITPGVCVAQIAVELVSELLGKDVRLTGAKNIKFLSVMTPDKPNVTYSLTLTEDKIQAVAHSDDTVFAKMSLAVSFLF